MKRPDLQEIMPLLEAGSDFSLTERQYQEKTGVTLPKNPSYLKKNSALARTAEKYGFKIEILSRTISLKKIR